MDEPAFVSDARRAADSGSEREFLGALLLCCHKLKGQQADPALVAPEPGPESATTTTMADAVLPDADAMPVRVGVGVIGSVIVFSLIMGARALNRRPQH